MQVQYIIILYSKGSDVVKLMVNKNTLGAKKWRGKEKQQQLKGMI